MKKRLIIACLACLGTAAAAQEDEGLSLMERGAQLFMEGIMRQMEPAMDDFQGLAEQFGPSLRSFAQEMGPALQDLLDEVKDWSVYHPPEILENGDIVIRKKTPEEIETPSEPVDI
ncbi:MAG: hypothetical protein AAGG57_18920 [Pseudomonadota bacterium]